jgi:hypothetical protein
MYANVGICHAGTCALADGTSASEAVIEIIKSTEIAIANVLFLLNCIYFSSPLRFIIINKSRIYI